MIDKRMSDYEYVKEAVIGPERFNRWKNYYITLINMIKVEAAKHVRTASNDLQFWKQYLRDFKRKGKATTAAQLVKVEA